MGHKPLSERRQHPRIEKHIPVKIGAPGADFVTETRNISCSGAYCYLEKFLEPMTKLQITLLVPVKKGGKSTTKKLVCGGVVVRTENVPNGQGFYSAIFFNDIHPKDARILAEYVSTVLQGAKASSTTGTSPDLN